MNKNELINVLSLASLKGEAESSSFCLNFEDGEINILNISSKSSIVGRIKYKSPTIIPIKTIGIYEVPVLIELLKKFSSNEIELKVKDNELIITSTDKNNKDKLKVKLGLIENLTNEVFNKTDSMSLKRATYFNEIDQVQNWLEVDSLLVKKIVDYFNACKCEQLVIQLQDNILYFKPENDKYKVSFEIPFEGEPFTYLVGKYFITLIDILKDCKIGFYNNKIYVKYELTNDIKTLTGEYFVLHID